MAANGNGARNGRSEWWKWTAAILGALLIGFIPYIVSANNFATEDDLAGIEAKIEAKGDEIRGEVAVSKAEIARIQAQISDLLDRIEQLRQVAAAALEQQSP